jgi:hypothetical protein
MGTGDLMTTTIKLTAAIYILLIAMRRIPKTKPAWLITAAVCMVVTSAHMYVHGLPGLFMSISGAAVSILLSIPLYRQNRISRSELIPSLAVGCILGPVGYSVAYLIAFTLFAVQYWLKAEKFIAGDRRLRTASPGGPDIIAADEKSALARIEARKILHGDNAQNAGDDLPRDRLEDYIYRHYPHRQENTFPWGAKLAVASLVVLMMGVPF